MFTLSMRGLGDIDDSDLATKIVSGHKLLLLVNVPSLYSSSSRAEIAEAQLAVWYIAEMLAKHSSKVEVDDEEGDDGSGDVRFCLDVTEPEGLPARLSWLAAALDPETEDDGTSRFDFDCEIEGWLVDRKNAPTQFPELRAAYEIDAAAAREYEDDLDDE